MGRHAECGSDGRTRRVSKSRFDTQATARVAHEVASGVTDPLTPAIGVHEGPVPGKRDPQTRGATRLAGAGRPSCFPFPPRGVPVGR